MSGSSGSSSDPLNSISVNGDRNQSIDRNYGNAFGNVEGNVYLSQQPKFLSLHQLPLDIDFTGRETDIQTIRQLSIDGTSVAISGMAGVGKSALAIHVAQQLAESDFPDVQLYVDLRGADGDGLDPAEVLAGFLRAFGLDESSIPRDLQERSRLYRSQLAGKRSIVLLDNAQDEAQVRPLLPGNGCAVIITSRRVLGALAAQSILLKVLSADDARNLLAKSIGMTRLEAEAQAAAEILRLCDGLPLAILIAGGTLKSKRHWSLAEYSQKLSDERERLERLQLSDLSVRASFELSYRELSVADGLLFGKLGILVGKDFGEDLAAVVHDSDRPVIDSIERLIDAQLLEANLDRRYRFHDLLRLFAREKLAESISLEQQEEIRQKIVDWGCQQSKMMDTYLRPVERHQMVQQWVDSNEVSTDFDEQYLFLCALGWFEQERQQLLSAIYWAKNAERWDVVVFFVTNLLIFCKDRSYWYDYEQICLVAMLAAEKVGDSHSEGITLNNLGILYRSQCQWSEAIDCYQQSLSILRECGDLDRVGAVLNNLGVVYRSLCQWDKAIDYLQQGLIINQKIGNWHGESLSLNNLGGVYLFQSQWDRAIGYYQKSLTISQDFSDLGAEASALDQLGAVFEAQSQWDKATDSCHKSLAIYRQLGYWHNVSGSLINLGNTYQSQNRWDEAKQCYEESLIISQELKDRQREGQSLVALGMVFNNQNQWGRAFECYKQSLIIFRAFSDRYGESKTLANFATLYRSQSLWDESIEYYQQSLTIDREIGNKQGEGQSLNNLGMVYDYQSRWDDAIELYHQGLEIFRELGDRNGEGMCLNNLGVVYGSQHQWNKAIKYFRQSLTIKQELGNKYGETQTLGKLGFLHEQQGQLDTAISLWQESLIKLPKGVAEYKETEVWLENAQNQQKFRSAKVSIMSIIIFGISSFFLLLTLISR